MNISTLTVEEFTSVEPITVHLLTSLEEVNKIMIANNFRHLPVMQGEECVGVITQRAIFSLPREQILSMKAQDVLTKDVFTVQKNDPLKDVVFEMSKRKLGSVIVLENNSLFGIFTSTDALNAIIEID